MRHETCKHEWNVYPYSFLSGNRCPKCGGRAKKDTAMFKNEVFEKAGYDFMVVGEYKDIDTKINIRHNVCGYVFSVYPYNFLNHSTCTFCRKNSKRKLRKTHDEFLLEFKLLSKGEYTLLDTYQGTKTKINVRHDLCGYEWKITPDNFIQGKRCPNCIASNGSRRIVAFLKQYNIEFTKEKTFDKCRGSKKPLPFDFYIDNKLLVEFDGEHHFEPVRYSKDGGKLIQKLKTAQTYDLTKNSFCINNNLHLVRIPYWDIEDIEYILFDALIYFGVLDGIVQEETLISNYYVNSNWDHIQYIRRAPHHMILI